MPHLSDSGASIDETIVPFPHPSHRTGQALLRHPALGQAHVFAHGKLLVSVAPALEIIDSRYENFRFSLTDVVCDNASASAFVIGPWSSPSIDVGNLGMLLEVDGSPRQIGSTAAILAHPVYALVAAARLVHAQGEQLLPGDIVMAGAATAAEPIAEGQFIQLSVEKVGECVVYDGEVTGFAQLAAARCSSGFGATCVR